MKKMQKKWFYPLPGHFLDTQYPQLGFFPCIKRVSFFVHTLAKKNIGLIKPLKTIQSGFFGTYGLFGIESPEL